MVDALLEETQVIDATLRARALGAPFAPVPPVGALRAPARLVAPHEEVREIDAVPHEEVLVALRARLRALVAPPVQVLVWVWT